MTFELSQVPINYNKGKVGEVRGRIAGLQEVHIE